MNQKKKPVWTTPVICGPLDLLRLITDSLQKLHDTRIRLRGRQEDKKHGR